MLKDERPTSVSPSTVLTDVTHATTELRLDRVVFVQRSDIDS
jgi:hypothetical protein